MPVQVNKDKAKEILSKYWKKKKLSKFSPAVHKVLTECLISDHKTYRYILFNGILAKCVNPSVDPIALQAGASIKGAFDARSLCHEVVVPFEKEVMNNRLGGSNEPFLNKPARFKTLDINNAVRRGKDKINLLKLIEIFNSDHFKSNPFLYFDHLICIVKETRVNQIEFDETNLKENISTQYVFNKTEKLLQNSFEGNSLVFSVLLILEISKLSLDSEIVISSNPLNQSGSSKNEICDIDIFDNSKNYLLGVEVKDKNFNETDIDHAVSKVRNFKHSRMIFLCKSLDQYKGEKKITDLLKNYEKSGFDLSITDFKNFLNISLILKQNLKKTQIISILNKHLKKTNSPIIFVKYLENIFNN